MQVNEVRVQIVSKLRGVCERADQVIVLDSLLPRLHTGSMIDVAVVLAPSRWMSRLWCFIESWLARSVVLKTADAAFDLDELFNLLFETVNNEEHRYFPLLHRLSRPRPASEENAGFIRSAPREDDRNPPLLAKMYHGCENRYTGVEVDQVRVLYLFLNLQ
jgi:hypothetical protein